MPKSSIPKPGNVALPSDLLHAIGHVAAIWAHLEHEIDSTIRQALDIPGAPEIDTALILPFAKRLTLYETLMQRLAESEHRTLLAEFVAAVKPLHAKRDIIVHGSVANSEQQREGGSVYWFRRVRWDRPARLLHKQAMTVAQVEAVAAAISDQVGIAHVLDIILWPHQDTSRDRAE